MANGAGIISQARLRPLYSIPLGQGGVGAPAPVGNGVGLSFGMGTGRVKLQGITFGYFDYAAANDLNAIALVGRVTAFNGTVPGGALGYLWNTNNLGIDTLFDQIVTGPGPFHFNLSISDLVTDDGQPLTVLVSQLYYPSGGGLSINGGSVLTVAADYQKHYVGGPDGDA